MKIYKHFLLMIFVSVFLFGCGSHNGGSAFLPSSESTASCWETYDEAMVNYKNIKVGMVEKSLKDYGIYDGGVNIRVLNWLSVYNMLPEDAVRRRTIDKGILDFIDAGDSRAKAFQINVLFEQSYREGSVFLDLFAFKRRTHTTGYEFNGLILLVDDKVSYVLRPIGGPIDKSKKEKKPLGPLQGIGDSFHKVFF